MTYEDKASYDPTPLCMTTHQMERALYYRMLVAQRALYLKTHSVCVAVVVAVVVAVCVAVCKLVAERAIYLKTHSK